MLCPLNISPTLSRKFFVRRPCVPPIEPLQIDAFSAKLATIIGHQNQEFLPKPPTIKTLEILPKALLKFKEVRSRNNRHWEEKEPMCGAVISFDYKGKKVSISDLKDDLKIVKNDEITTLLRNFKFENKIYESFKKRGFVTLKDSYSYNIIQKDDFLVLKEQFEKKANKIIPARWEEFVNKDIPILEKEGWTITFDKDFPYNIVHPQDDWYASIEQPEGYSWFDVELGVTVDNERLNLVPILLSLLKSDEDILENLEKLSKNETYLVPIKGGRKLALKASRVYLLLKTLKQLFSYQRSLSEKEELRLEALEAALLAEMEEATKSLNLRWFGNTNILDLGKKLHGFTKLKSVKPAKEFKGTLRHYQQDGLNWLQFLKEHNLAGILADDMGLGKTVQVLCHITKEKEQNDLKNPFLVIAPTSLMLNWNSEAVRFAPHLKVLVLHGPKRKKDFDSIQDHDLVLTTYPLLLKDKENLLKYSYHTVVLDEAQTIKNARAKMTQIAYQLKAAHRLCMTGTPLENHLGELWSLFNFLMPGYLGKDKQFTQLFRNPIEKGGDLDKSKALARRIKPFVLRRTKKEVATELPPKTEILHHIELEGPQRDLYETIRVSMHEKVREEIAQKGAEKSHIIVLDALLKLRQVCCDPALLKINHLKEKTTSAKLEELISMLVEMVSEGRKILLFSQFTSMLAIIEERLKKEGISYALLTGQTKDRQAPIMAFQEGDTPVFLISLKAGGTGLNLTAADTVIHYDPWWNPAVENQATDRAYRIGQDKPVFVYRLITKGTVEEKIIAMQERKAKLMGSLFDPNAKAASKLTATDIQALFEPLE